MAERAEFKPNPNDPQWEIKYWSGALDSYHDSIYISAPTTPLDYRGSHRRKPGLPNYYLHVRIKEIGGLNYPALLANQFGSSAYLSIGVWEVSSRKALTFLQIVEPHLFIKKLQVQLGIEFQKDKALTNKLPPAEKTAYRLTIGETYCPEMTVLNTVDIYDQSRFNVPDQLDPAYVIGLMECGLRPHEDKTQKRRVNGLSLAWRSKTAAEKVQAYFGGGITDITVGGFRNIWGIENSRVLLTQVQPFFKLRHIVDLEPPFISDPKLRELFTDYHRGIVNLAVALRYPHPSSKHPDQRPNRAGQIAGIGFHFGYLAGMKQCLDILGLSEYTEKSQQQADRLLSLK